jgi:hypothetical protein
MVTSGLMGEIVPVAMDIYGRRLKSGMRGGRMDRQDNGHVKVFVTQSPINEQS